MRIRTCTHKPFQSPTGMLPVRTAKKQLDGGWQPIDARTSSREAQIPYSFPVSHAFIRTLHPSPRTRKELPHMILSAWKETRLTNVYSTSNSRVRSMKACQQERKTFPGEWTVRGNELNNVIKMHGQALSAHMQQ